MYTESVQSQNPGDASLIDDVDHPGTIARTVRRCQTFEAEASTLRSKPKSDLRGRAEAKAEAKFKEAEQNDALIEYLT